ncbi:MAG: hypothetical protein RR575_00320 [Acinetobacter sp.]
MDNYFIENLGWSRCTNPINAIDFEISTAELGKLTSVLELLGLTLYDDIEETLSNTQDYYLMLNVKGTRVEITLCGERIAPVPLEYISTIVPALILAHIHEPESVKQIYNDFFINKKEEITPLLDE